MILGIGTDLCSISRMSRALRSNHFRDAIFHEDEIAYASAQALPARHFASSFAAREALAKATGISTFSIVLKGAWIIRTKNGPCFRYTSEIASLIGKKGIQKAWNSLSHEDDLAAAFVIVEGESARA